MGFKLLFYFTLFLTTTVRNSHFLNKLKKKTW